MKYFDEIEKYLNGEMSSPEKEDFEARLQSNLKLARAYKHHLEVYKALKDKDMIEFRRKMGEIGEDYRQEGRKREKPGFNLLFSWITASAAMLLVLVSLIAILWLIPRHRDQISRDQRNISADSTLQLPESFYELKDLVVRGGEHSQWEPKDSTIFPYGKAITFRSNAEPDTVLTLEVYRLGHGLEVREHVSVGAVLLMIKPLETGAYYYKVLRSDSLLYIGYFLVEE